MCVENRRKTKRLCIGNSLNLGGGLVDFLIFYGRFSHYMYDDLYRKPRMGIRIGYQNPILVQSLSFSCVCIYIYIYTHVFVCVCVVNKCVLVGIFLTVIVGDIIVFSISHY